MHHTKICRWFGLKKEAKHVRTRKVVVRHDGGIDGEPADSPEGLGAQRETRHPRRQCLEEKQKEEVRVRRGHYEGTAVVPSLDEGAEGGKGIWGSLPRSLVSRGAV